MAHGVGRFVLSSTANLFDRPERMPIEPGARIEPGSPYGESKYILERVLAWLERTSGLRYAALRYFNAAGASAQRGEDHDPETHLIPLVLQVALGQRPEIQVFGGDYPTPDGTCIRDYIHVLDLADAHLLALEALEHGSRTYNLGNGQGFSVQQVIDVAREITGHAIAGQDQGPPAGRPGGADCRCLGRSQRAWLGAASRRSARDRRERLALAPGAPQGLCRLTARRSRHSTAPRARARRSKVAPPSG